MRAYETTFILVPSLDAEGMQGAIDEVKSHITSAGGEITVEKEWGRRRLAYPIQDHSEGIYHILRFNFSPGALPELDRFFKLNENVLRALVILDEGTPLDYVGQVSESEDRDSRDGDDRRDRRGPRGDRGDRGGDRGDRGGDRGERSSSAPAAASAPAPAGSGGEETS